MVIGFFECSGSKTRRIWGAGSIQESRVLPGGAADVAALGLDSDDAAAARRHHR